jgi:hypothetical protein
MPVFRAEVAVKVDLRLSKEFEYNEYHFSPTSDGFNMELEMTAPTTDEARSVLAVKTQLLLDSLTLTKGPTLRYQISQIAQKPTPGGTLQVLTAQVFMTASAHVVLSTDRAGITPAIEMVNRVSSHPKVEILTQALRWYGQGVSDSDSIDRFVDFWVALEAHADSYEGTDVQPYSCECGRLINSRPINGVLRAYLNSLGLKQEAQSISTMSSARGDLFHRALAPNALEQLPEVQRILKTCIQKMSETAIRNS